MPSQPTNSGIVTDETGERKIPESVRADGSTRKAIKIRPGYRPPEDVEVYKNRTAETFRNRGKGPVPGSEGIKDNTKADSSASNKNAKRREARKKAKAEGEGDDKEKAEKKEEVKEEVVVVDEEAEKEKKARNLKKKLRQARDLKEKKEGGGSLLPEQIAKVIKINELIRELDALGYDAEGEKKKDGEEEVAVVGEGVVVGEGAENEKKMRNLKKKLREAKELKEKKEGGGSLLPEQIAKVIRIDELIRELDALGFDAEVEKKEEAKAGSST